jgi:hypothetical protein
VWASIHLIAVGGAPAEALAAAAVSPGWRPRASPLRDQRRGRPGGGRDGRRGDVVLVKGSRGVKTDRVVDRLKAERG